MDVEKELRRAVDTGKVCFGFRQSELNVLKGKGLLVVLSGNTPMEQGEKMEHIAGVSQIPVLKIGKNSLQLGSICGKPFPVSAMVVLDKGKSKVLDAVKKQ